MALPTYTYTYGAFGAIAFPGIIAEDVLQFIVNMTPSETPLLATIPTVQVESVQHDWIQDSLLATSTAAAAEAFDFAEGSASVPVRGTAATRNVTTLLQKGVKVSNSMQRSNTHAVDNWYKYQVFKGMRERARDLERIILSRYTGQSAVGTTASPTRKMRRLVDFCKNAGARFHIRSTAFGESGGAGAGGTACATIFNDRNLNGILAKVYSQGGYPDVVHVNEAAKRQISRTTVNSSYRRNIDASEREMIFPVDIVETEFGRLEIYLNRNVPQSGASRVANGSAQLHNGAAVFMERGMVRLGVYRPFEHVPLAPAGDYMRGYIVGEYTLEVGNALACMWARGIAGWSD